MIINTHRDLTNTTELKIISTRVYNGSISPDEGDNVLFTKGSLLFPCGGHTALEVTILVSTPYWSSYYLGGIQELFHLEKERKRKIGYLHSCFLHLLLM